MHCWLLQVVRRDIGSELKYPANESYRPIGRSQTYNIKLGFAREAPDANAQESAVGRGIYILRGADVD